LRQSKPDGATAHASPFGDRLPRRGIIPGPEWITPHLGQANSILPPENRIDVFLLHLPR